MLPAYQICFLREGQIWLTSQLRMLLQIRGYVQVLKGFCQCMGSTCCTYVQELEGDKHQFRGTTVSASLASFSHLCWLPDKFWTDFLRLATDLRKQESGLPCQTHFLLLALKTLLNSLTWIWISKSLQTSYSPLIRLPSEGCYELSESQGERQVRFLSKEDCDKKRRIPDFTK